MLNLNNLKKILKKGVQIGVLSAALTAGAVMGTGCAQPSNTIEDDQGLGGLGGNGGNGGDKETTYGYDKTIGNGNYNMHNFMGENPTLITDYTTQETQTKSAVKNVNAYLKEAKTYTEDLANKLEQSLNGRSGAQAYFKNIISTMKNNNYFHINENIPGGQDFDAAVNKNFFAGEYIFTDIIKSLGNDDERRAFEYCYRILANETYKEGLGNYRNFESPLMDSYNDEKELLASRCSNNEEFKKYNIDLANIYQQNKLIKFTPITDLTDRLLNKAKTKLNNTRNLDLQLSDMQQFINISLTLNSLGAMHDYTKGALQHNRGCLMGNGLGFYNQTMHDAAEEAWQEEQQYQQLYQASLSR